MLSRLTYCSVRAPRVNTSLTTRFFTTTVRKAQPAIRTPPKPATLRSSIQAPIERSRPDRIQRLAAQISRAGREEIYRNTAVTSYIAATLSIVVLSYSSIGYIFSTMLWNDEVAKERGLDWKVPKAYQGVIIVWGCFAAYAFTRTIGIVKSIRIIQNDGKYQLQTLIRRPIPFMRPEKYISEPHQLLLNRGELLGATQYEDMITGSDGGSFLSRITRTLFYTPFHNTRKAMGGVGLVPVQIGPTGSQRHLKLDVDGLFSNGGQDLMDLSSEDEL